MSKLRYFNYIEKNIALLKQAPKLTVFNLEALRPEPKKKPEYGRKGQAPWGHENPYARELGDDGHNPPWYLWVATKPVVNSGLHFSKLSLGKIQYHVDKGSLNPDKITMFDLISKDIVPLPNDHNGIELSIQGISLFEAKINIEVTMACERTVDAIEQNGGTVLTRWYSEAQLSQMKEKIDCSSKVELPPLELVHKYLDPDLRGYLIGKEELYFKDMGRAHKILEHLRRTDETIPQYNDSDSYSDILQERIDAKLARALKHLPPED